MRAGVIALDTPARLKAQIAQKDVLRLEVAGWSPKQHEAVAGVPGVESLAARYLDGNSTWEVSLQAQDSRAVLPGIIQTVNQNGTHLVNMNIVRPSLEDVFINLTGKALRD